MKDEKYGLYFEGTSKYGKKEIYPILIDKIDIIDMYTCYCKNGKELFDLFPNNPNIKAFIYDNFSDDIDFYNEDSDKYIDKHFYVRKVPKKRIRTSDYKNMEVLYRKDRDVVYLNKLTKENEIYSFLSKLKLTISECNLANTKSINNKKVIEYKIKYEFFKNVFEDVQKRNKKLVDLFDDNACEFVNNRIYNLATNTSNLKLLSKEVRKDSILRRNLVLEIKDTLKKLDDLNGVKTRMLSIDEVDNRCKRREEQLYFNINKIFENMKVLLVDEIDYFNNKYNLIIPSRPEHIDEDKLYLDNDYIDEEYDDFLGPKKANEKRYRSIN